MFEQYIVKNLSSFEDEQSFKCPTLAYAELERRQSQGIECEVFFTSSYDINCDDDASLTFDDLSIETGINVGYRTYE